MRDEGMYIIEYTYRVGVCSGNMGVPRRVVVVDIIPARSPSPNTLRQCHNVIAIAIDFDAQ
jgi:hypothetical protein